MSDTVLWDWGHNGVGSAALVYGACLAGQGSLASCCAVSRVADCLGGVCCRTEQSQACPRMTSYLLSKGAGQDIYTSFASLKGGGTNSPAISSLIPVLGWKERLTPMARLTSASTSTTTDNSRCSFPAKPNVPRKHHWHECAQQLL